MVPGIIESSGEPIRNPVTGAEHRICLDLPDGFEYRLAEMGGGRTKVLGQIQLAFTHTYGQFRASIWAMRASSISTPAEWFARRERAVVMAKPRCDGCARLVLAAHWGCRGHGWRVAGDPAARGAWRM